MSNKEQIGRRADRIQYPTAFPGGYLNVETPDNLAELRADLVRALITAGCKEKIYDKNATAYYQDDCPLRTEPIMLSTWVGILDGKAPVPERGHYGFDTVGLKVIIRGDGEIQNMIRSILAGYEPDDTNGHEGCETYSFGCKHIGTKMLDTPLTAARLKIARDLHEVVNGGLN